MATSADLQGRLDAIEEAIASGVMQVTYDGKSAGYRSLAEMVSIRDTLRRELGLPGRSRRTVAGFRSGFGR